MITCPFLIGDMLYASCSAEFYGEVVGIGEDAGGIPTIDLRILNPNDLIDFPYADAEEQCGMRYGNKEWPDFHGLTLLEIPGDVKPILRGVQYKHDPEKDMGAYIGEGLDGYKCTGAHVVCLTPGNGCYRCTKLFSVYRKAAST